MCYYVFHMRWGTLDSECTEQPSMARTGILVEFILLACCFNEFISFCKLCFSCVYFVVCIFFLKLLIVLPVGKKELSNFFGK